ncbi:MAG: hypothetical protein GY850_37710 [bacterium]|nr:hypothetical protein [bacterium]
MKKILLTAMIVFLFGGTGMACKIHPSNSPCEFERTIAGRCYIANTNHTQTLNGVEITITDLDNSTISKKVYTDQHIAGYDDVYIVQFSCSLRELIFENLCWCNGRNFSIEAEATFEDPEDGNVYTLVSEQYPKVEVKCGRTVVKNFDYELSTAVLLASFNAVPGNGNVVLSWESSDETDNFGFNLYRSIDGKSFTQINETIIFADGAEGLGANYEFTDDDDVENRTEYMYVLESVDTFGDTEVFEPVVATPRMIYRLLGR